MSIKVYNGNKKVRLNTPSAPHTTFCYQLICPERSINTDYYSLHRVIIYKRKEGPEETPLHDLLHQSLFVLIHVSLTAALKSSKLRPEKQYQLLSLLLVGAVATHPG